VGVVTAELGARNLAPEERCSLWWCDQLPGAHQWQPDAGGRTRLHQHTVGGEAVGLLQCEHDPGPWSKVTVDLDLGEADDATTLRRVAEDVTAAAVLLERIASRSSC
jgi:hypothetical protein